MRLITPKSDKTGIDCKSCYQSIGGKNKKVFITETDWPGAEGQGELVDRFHEGAGVSPFVIVVEVLHLLYEISGRHQQFRRLDLRILFQYLSHSFEDFPEPFVSRHSYCFVLIFIANKSPKQRHKTLKSNQTTNLFITWNQKTAQKLNKS